MPIIFANMKKGANYSRKQLAHIWGYTSFHAIARGVVTPRSDNKIVLFVTEKKQPAVEQYADRLVGDSLEWEGPTDHFAENRIVNASIVGDEIHLFHRETHHMDFTYYGQIIMVSKKLNSDRPSQFKFKVMV